MGLVIIKLVNIYWLWRDIHVSPFSLSYYQYIAAWNSKSVSRLGESCSEAPISHFISLALPVDSLYVSSFPRVAISQETFSKQLPDNIWYCPSLYKTFTIPTAVSCLQLQVLIRIG